MLKIIRTITIDMWYEDDYQNADKIDITFYPNECVYRGNIYINNKIVGDYICKNSTDLEKVFSQLNFNWD